MPFKNSYWEMLLAAFVFSLVDILLKSLSSSFPAAGIAFFRFLTGGLILGAIILGRGGSLRGGDLRMLVLRGITGTLAFFCLVKSVSMITLPNAIVLFYTAPLFVVPLSFLFLGERVRKTELVLIVIGFIGIYILINPGSHAFNIGIRFRPLIRLYRCRCHGTGQEAPSNPWSAHHLFLFLPGRRDHRLPLFC